MRPWQGGALGGLWGIKEGGRLIEYRSQRMRQFEELKQDVNRLKEEHAALKGEVNTHEHTNGMPLSVSSVQLDGKLQDDPAREPEIQL